MTGSLPSWVDLNRAPARSDWTDAVPGERLPRLAEAGVSLAGAARVELQLRVPEFRSDHVPATASGRIVAQVQAECQRCLAPLAQAVDEAFDWVLLDTDSAEGDDSTEPVLLQDGRFEVMDAITDQILLALPAYPRHADDCVAGGTLPNPGPSDGTIDGPDNET